MIFSRNCIAVKNILSFHNLFSDEHYLNTAGATRKPNSVSVSGYPETDNDHSSKGCRLLCTSCDLPGSSDGQPSDTPLFGLAPGGVCKASPVTRRTGALLPHLFTLTLPKRGGIFSVALSFASPRLHVMEHPALRCSDFPQDRNNPVLRSSGLLLPYFMPSPSILLSDSEGKILCCRISEAHYTSGVEYSYCIRCKSNRLPAQLQFPLSAP